MAKIKVENQNDIAAWLREDDTDKLAELFAYANKVRQDNVGDDIHLRGLIEISNRCSRDCAYCGINATNTTINRYSLSDDEIMASVKQAVELGYGTAVLQAGEDKTIKPELIADLVRNIKSETGLAVTLSLGEWPDEVYRMWKEAGADRYLLKFETSDRELFNRIHPGSKEHRLDIIPCLQKIGFEMGSGVMVGLPGQSYESLAEDIFLFSNLNLDMVGIGPYIPDQATILGSEPEKFNLDPKDQVQSNEVMSCKAIALTRIMCPTTNMPVTTSLSTLNTTAGLEKGLSCGGNVVMPNLTPLKYRTDYHIYPGKASLLEPKAFLQKLDERIDAIGRNIAAGRGDSLKFMNRNDGQVQNEH
jgi:biotin synthase